VPCVGVPGFATRAVEKVGCVQVVALVRIVVERIYIRVEPNRVLVALCAFKEQQARVLHVRHHPRLHVVHVKLGSQLGQALCDFL